MTHRISNTRIVKYSDNQEEGYYKTAHKHC